AESVWVARKRVDAELELVCGGADRDEQIEIRRDRGTQAALAGRRRDGDRVDGLAWPVLARVRQHRPRRVPEGGARPRLADAHAAPRLVDHLCERLAPGPRRNEVRARVTQRAQLPVTIRDRDKAAEPAPRDVLEEHALDRVVGAEREHLLAR